MNNKQLKAILMAILSPNGNTINIDSNMFAFLDRNSREIMNICGIKEDEKEVDSNVAN